MSSKKNRLSKIRIIAGKWRSRQIIFPAVTELRPTQDMIRETLFNWLNSYIEAAVCLDLFAGSGALGFEALSRGASKVVFIDSNKNVLHSLQENAKNLDAQNAQVIYGECPNHMPSFPKELFKIVFIDPPYKKDLVKEAIDWLINGNLLKKDALIYIEAEKELSPLPIPSSWKIIKSKITRTLQCHLIACSGLLD